MTTRKRFSVPRATVELGEGESLSLRGFSFEDALGLYYRHAGELAALFDHFAKGGEAAIEADDVRQLGGTLLARAPALIAEVIAVASGEDADGEDFADVVADFRHMPAGPQLDALQKVHALTFTSDMPPGKFAAVVLGMAQSATAILPARLP